MKIVIGNKLLDQEVKELGTDRVNFVAQDGRELFSVSILDETTIDIRGVNVCKIDGNLYTEVLQIEPRAANSVWIRAKQYQP